MAVPRVCASGQKRPEARRVGGRTIRRLQLEIDEDTANSKQVTLTTRKTHVTLFTAELSSDEMRALENIVQQPQQPSNTPHTIKVRVCVRLCLVVWACGRSFVSSSACLFIYLLFVYYLSWIGAGSLRATRCGKAESSSIELHNVAKSAPV